MGHTIIYYLHNGDNKPFYIGKTNNITARLKNHRNTYENAELKVISEVIDWRRWEKYYIKKYRNLGYQLLNINEGGGGPLVTSEETKAKISKALTGRKVSKSTRKKMSLVRIGKPLKQSMPANHGELISKAKKGVPNPKLREAIIGKPKVKKSWKVLVYSLEDVYIGEYESALLCAKDLTETSSLKAVAGSIRDVCVGRQISAYGFKYKYNRL